MNSLNIYDSLEIKVKRGYLELTQDERDKLQDLLIDRYTERVTRISDEELIQMANDERIF